MPAHREVNFTLLRETSCTFYSKGKVCMMMYTKHLNKYLSGPLCAHGLFEEIFSVWSLGHTHKHTHTAALKTANHKTSPIWVNLMTRASAKQLQLSCLFKVIFKKAIYEYVGSNERTAHMKRFVAQNDVMLFERLFNLGRRLVSISFHVKPLFVWDGRL